MKLRAPLALAALLATAAGPAAAQNQTQARPDTTAAIAHPARASWTSDRMPLRVGDLLTVVVDEQTAARERVSKVATGNRALKTNLRAETGGDPMAYSIGSGVDKGSRDVGEAQRQGDLTAVLTVQVKTLTPEGIARIEGSRKVTVDGRLQEISVQGLVRAEDVSTSNTVLSSRIAEAVITYKGKAIGPRTGIMGKILSMLWP